MASTLQSATTVKDLEWFKLSNYAGLKKASFSTWQNVLLNRMIFEKAARDAINNEEMRQFILQQFEAIKLDPLLIEDRYEDEPVKKSPEALKCVSTVQSLTVENIKQMHFFITNSHFLGNKSGSKTLDTRLFADPNMAVVQRGHAVVDLNATDKRIVSDFKEWLKGYRENYFKVIGGDYRKKANNWAQALLIPYVDLEIFGNLTGKKIPLQKKIALLFPKTAPDIGIDQIRRLRELKKNVLAEQTIRIIMNLAKDEIKNQGK